MTKALERHTDIKVLSAFALSAPGRALLATVEAKVAAWEDERLTTQALAEARTRAYTRARARARRAQAHAQAHASTRALECRHVYIHPARRPRS